MNSNNYLTNGAGETLRLFEIKRRKRICNSQTKLKYEVCVCVLFIYPVFSAK